MSVPAAKLDVMDITLVLIGVAALIIGGILGFLLGRNLTATKTTDSSGSQAALKQELAQARTDLAQAQTQVALAQRNAQLEIAKDLAQANAQVAQAKVEAEQAKAASAEAQAQLAKAQAEVAGAQAERKAALNQAEQIKNDREQLLLNFKSLSAQVLEKHGKDAEEAAAKRLERTETVLQPVANSLEKLNERINQVEQQRATMSAQLNEQVRNVVATSESLRRETNALSTALRKPQVRGNWGEMQLKRVVELAGMVEYVDFYQQETTKTSGEATIRPDMKVMLGQGGKFIYVDSKVPLSAFLDAQETGDDQVRVDKLKVFGQNVRSHIDQLSGKRYWTADSHSPEFVVLFIPAETLAAEALNQMPDLIEYGSSKNVILATPTTLIGMLRAVAYGWKQAALADSAQEVFETGRELYERLCTIGGYFGSLGRSLNSSVLNYNKALASLESRVFVTARRFRDMKVTQKELEELKSVDQSVRLIQSPELVASDSRAELEPAKSSYTSSQVQALETVDISDDQLFDNES